MNQVVVAVPARNEAATVAATLTGILASLERARADGLVSAAAVEVAAHRCVDATASRASAALRGHQGALVTRDDWSTTVGAVRDRAVRRGLSRLPADPARTWVLSTDADTAVGPDWVVGILTEAARARVVGVVGLAPLDAWRGGPEGAAAYDRLVDAGMRDGVLHQHDHVYGANLAVRADAYLDVGGFAHVAHGEDQALVDALAGRHHRLLRTRAVSVTTSGRMRGRASGGLADHLARLEATALLTRVGEGGEGSAARTAPR